MRTGGWWVMEAIETVVHQPDSGQAAARRGLRLTSLLVAIFALGGALGACTKCDVPNWLPKNPGQPPQSCHDAPAPQ
jgi:hypothetical protein